jgi:phenylalanyl-tRNA synthetase beta chain
MTIEPRAIGGVTSEGMLCSEAELGLSDEGDGIIVFAPDFAQPGTPLLEVLPSARDTIFEVSLTPNRPDGLGHIGLARELSVLFELPFMPPRHQELAAGDHGIAIVIDDGERCPHYASAVLSGVTVGPSPSWVRHRLNSLGVRSISNVVDVTNLVLLEYGHPMHAFDLTLLRGSRVHVRQARPGEVLRTIDGSDRDLDGDDLVIADAEGPTALAGVMGGAGSEVKATTANLFFECAYFDPRTVRRSARRHGMHTESSHRFERGVDHGDTDQALARAVALTRELAGGSLRGVKRVDKKAIASTKVTLRTARMTQLLGHAIDRGVATRVLKSLGFAIEGEDAGADTYRVPTHRPDVSREVDLIEEVVRVVGLDAIAAVRPRVRPSASVGGRERLLRRVREEAVGLGLSEALTYAFVAESDLDLLGAPAPVVRLANPLHEHHTVMRTTLLPGLLQAAARARRHNEHQARLFALGSAFLEGGDLPTERPMVAILLGGERPAILTRAQPYDALDVKGVAVSLVERLVHATPDVVPFDASSRPRHLHPRAAGRLMLAGAEIGQLGLLHPDAVEALDLDGAVFVAEIDLSLIDIDAPKRTRFAPIAKFPISSRDLAVVVADNILAGEVAHVIREVAGDLAERVDIFDRFQGGALPSGQVSLAFHVVYRAPDRTLTDVEVDLKHAAVVTAVTSRFGGTLRA